jgi:hypothetical protein
MDEQILPLIGILNLQNGILTEVNSCLLPQRRDPSLFPFRFISPWSTTALLWHHEHPLSASPSSYPQNVFINKVLIGPQ